MTEEVEVIEGDRAKVSEKVKEMYNWHCVITGQGGPNVKEEIEAAHIEHAGMGGQPSTHTVDNIIPVHFTVHEVWHEKRDYFKIGDRKVVKICDVEYEPLEKLEIEAKIGPAELESKIIKNQPCEKIPHDLLWFYNMPTEQGAEQAFKYHQQVVNGKETMVEGILMIGEGLYWIRELEGYRDLGHENFTSYLGSPEIGMKRQYAYKFINVYETFGLELSCSPDRLEKIGVNKLYMITDHVDEENVDEMLERAQGNSMSDLDKYLSDDQVAPNCKDCINVEKCKLANYKQGSSPLHCCSVERHPYIIETMNKKDGESNSCSEFDAG